MKKRSKLGLHTKFEQAKASLLAREAYEIGIEAKGAGDPVRYAQAEGYLSAIMDLAQAEGVARLVTQARRMLEDLTGA